MYTRLDAINEILKGVQQEILLEDFKDVYALETLTLSIFLHLPTGSPVQKLNLYRYLPTPFRFSNETPLFTVDPPRFLLAASLTDESKNVELSLMDFEWCDKIRHYTFCPARPRETYNSCESCLTALFRRISTVVRRKCCLLYTSPSPRD